MIRVLTRRGAIELRARVDRAVPEGMVSISFALVEAAANILTNPTAQLDQQKSRIQILRRKGREGRATGAGGGVTAQQIVMR
jgi:anaerobic selenocysteine-containing dehydrogenase